MPAVVRGTLQNVSVIMRSAAYCVVVPSVGNVTPSTVSLASELPTQARLKKPSELAIVWTVLVYSGPGSAITKSQCGGGGGGVHVGLVAEYVPILGGRPISARG